MKNKPVLFFIHGFSLGGWYFDDYKAYFEALGYRCVAPTLPFHDQSPDDTNPKIGKVCLQDHIDFLEREILKLKEKPVVIGHSMGGLLAQHLVNNGSADSAVLLQPAPPRGISMLNIRTLYHSTKLILNAILQKPVRYSFESAKPLFFNGLPDDMARALHDRSVYDSGKVMLEISMGWNPAIDPANVKGKVLVVAGSKDLAIRPAVLKKVARKFGEKATYVEFDRAHEIVIEPGWNEVTAYIHSWIELNVSGPVHGKHYEHVIS